MPPEGVALVRHEDIMSFEEIAEFSRIAVQKGIRKIRITGGEPLLRRGVTRLVEMLASIDGLQDLAMTTNGTQLSRFASDLVAAGLHRVNVSLDATDQERFRQITRCGEVHEVIEGIEAALRAGLRPVKLNCVINESSSETDAQDVTSYAKTKGLEVRFIRRMQPETGLFSIVDGGTGGNCSRCNRLRLSSTGILRPCLFSDLGFSVRELGAERAIREAIQSKPELGSRVTENWIRAVGG